jgi:hypothetical protein
MLTKVNSTALIKSEPTWQETIHITKLAGQDVSTEPCHYQNTEIGLPNPLTSNIYFMQTCRRER